MELEWVDLHSQVAAHAIAVWRGSVGPRVEPGDDDRRGGVGG
jgi:hypothetical protein